MAKPSHGTVPVRAGRSRRRAIGRNICLTISSALMLVGVTPGVAFAGCGDGPAAGVNWDGCTFQFANLADADLSGASMVRADLRYSVLFRADLSGSNLDGANFKDSFPVAANLSLAQARSANFQDADLVGANLTQADFRRADLSGADLDFADISGANFAGANLSGTDFDNATGVATAIFGTPPEGVDDFAVTRAGERVALDLLGNDDPDNTNPSGVLRVSVKTAPANGQFNAASGVYTPRPGFVGLDRFTYVPVDRLVLENLPNGARTEYAGAETTVIVRVVRTVVFTGRYAGMSGDEGEIARLYAASLNRQPDDAGFDFWLGRYRGGDSLERIAAEFLASSEFLGDTSGLADAEFVTVIYHNVFGRNPDAEGFNFWVGELRNGLSRAKLLVLFANGPEFKTLTGSS